MPLFLAAGLHVAVPLEETYAAAWDAVPEAIQEVVVTGFMPVDDDE
jgi:hypothetical protein